MEMEAKPMEDVSLMTAQEVAAFLRMPKSTVYYLAQTGELPGFQLGRSWRFPKDDILKLTFTLPRRPGVLTLGAETIYVRETDEGYYHGLRFIIIDKDTLGRIKQFVHDTLLQDS